VSSLCAALAVLALGASACGRIGFDPIARAAADGGAPPADATPTDDAPRTEDAAVMPPCPFGEPEPIAGLASPDYEDGAWMSADLLTVVFGSIRAGGPGSIDLYVATRGSPDSPFMEASLLPGDVNTPAAAERDPEIVGELEMYFIRGGDFLHATRADPSSPWITTFGALPPLEGSNDACPSLTNDGLELFYSTERVDGGGGEDVWVTSRSATTADFTGGHVAVGTAGQESCPSVTGDGLTLVYQSGSSLFITTRRDRAAELGPAAPVFSTQPAGTVDQRPKISKDGRVLVFASTRGGGGNYDLWMATRCAP